VLPGIVQSPKQLVPTFYTYYERPPDRAQIEETLRGLREIDVPIVKKMNR